MVDLPTARAGCCWCLQVHAAIQTTTTNTTTPSTVPSTMYISWFSTTSSPPASDRVVVPAAWLEDAAWGVDHTWRRSCDRSKSPSSPALPSIHSWQAPVWIKRPSTQANLVCFRANLTRKVVTIQAHKVVQSEAKVSGTWQQFVGKLRLGSTYAESAAWSFPTVYLYQGSSCR